MDENMMNFLEKNNMFLLTIGKSGCMIIYMKQKTKQVFQKQRDIYENNMRSKMLPGDNDILPCEDAGWRVS